MNSKPTIAVVMGGSSAEREISLQTGAGVIRALEALGYPLFSLDFDESFVDLIHARRPDALFNALHGGSGEDGTIQAILDWLHVPYQGSGVMASAVAMDKIVAKAIMRDHLLPTPQAQAIDLPAASSKTVTAAPALPCVVKPRAEGSAVGVTIVRSAKEWEAALHAAAALGGRIIVEEYIEGREFTVAVLGDTALPIVEISPHDGFYSYRAKYTAGASTHTVPADVTAVQAQRMHDYALRLHKALGCRDYSRIDMIMSTDGSIFLLECNTLPGLTPLSLFPEAAGAAGIGYANLIERLLQSALARGKVHAA